ncbi:MAG: hypothetical protein WAO35_22650 [Terriglobia bacterium]
MKPKGKPKFPPTVKEETEIVTLAAGLSQTHVAESLGRSRSLVKSTLDKPEIQRAVQGEKLELSQIYREKARAVVTSISEANIKDASLQQKCISSGILLDKSLLLAGEATSNVNVRLMMEVLAAIRDDTPLPPALPPDKPE